MDEPFTGLDDDGSQMLLQVLQEERAKDHIILASTHELSQLGTIADGYLRVEAGKVLAASPTEVLA
jgi:ABC-2 type transport system ATP-binding protein/heme exporter protein A